MKLVLMKKSIKVRTKRDAERIGKTTNHDVVALSRGCGHEAPADITLIILYPDLFPKL